MNTTKRTLEEFFDSSLIWADIVEELIEWLGDIHIQLENNDGELSGRSLDRLGGNAEALRNVIDLKTALMTKNLASKFNEGENDA